MGRFLGEPLQQQALLQRVHFLFHCPVLAKPVPSSSPMVSVPCLCWPLLRSHLCPFIQVPFSPTSGDAQGSTPGLALRGRPWCCWGTRRGGGPRAGPVPSGMFFHFSLSPLAAAVRTAPRPWAAGVGVGTLALTSPSTSSRAPERGAPLQGCSWAAPRLYSGCGRPEPLAAMVPRALPWALALLGAALALRPAAAPEPPPERLCGHHFVRALVRVCGGPRWAPEDARPAAGGDREWGKGGRARGTAGARGRRAWSTGCRGAGAGLASHAAGTSWALHSVPTAPPGAGSSR